MWTRATTLTCVLAMALAIGLVPGVRADDDPDVRLDHTPPRLSFADGQVSFWRPGAEDWTQAQINTPLAPGDVLVTGSPGTLEVQIGARAFVRAWGNTQLSLANQEPDFIQFMLTAGSAVFDLRTLEPGRTVEVNTPNAAVTIEQPGYYRVDVIGERSRVMTRRAGRATVTPATGQTVTVTPSEEVVIEGTTNPRLAAYAALPLDDWDRWNDTRTTRLLDAASARYVPSGTYGLSDLDPHGTWRVVPTYGTVWVPTGVPAGWTPYSTGSWILDPVYGWTWVDTAPWGWAPYHHGRWCFVNGYWAWAPGPVIGTPVYAPALVAFFDGPTGGASIGSGGPAVGWVALGWGEPVVPWWGRRGGRREPSWRGWGGPRVVNNVVIHNTTVVNVHHITGYRNASVPHAVVAVDRTRFGHGPTATARVLHVDGQRMKPVHGAPQISATAASFAPTAIRGVRPPEESLKRPVVATRSPRRESDAAPARAHTGASPTVSLPPERLVTVPKPQQLEPDGGRPRPSFGHGTGERPMTHRQPSPAPARPGGISVAPLSPRAVDAPSPSGRQTGAQSPPTGKNPSGSPPGAGHPADSFPAARQVEPNAGKGPTEALSPGPTDRPRPVLRSGPTPRQADGIPGRAPSMTGPTGAPPPAVQPGPSSRETGKGRGGASMGIPQTRGEVRTAPRLGTRADGAPTAAGYTGDASGRGVRRPETSRQPAPPLAGEPASRLAPGRGSKRAISSGEPRG